MSGYDGFLDSITKRYNGKLKNTHQLHAMLSLVGSFDEVPFLSGVEKYKSALREIMNKDVFKYGYLTNLIESNKDKIPNYKDSISYPEV